MRWKIHLSYLGTRYAGWQRQPGDMSVQQQLEEAFTTILRHPVELTGCGRTDAGVHARAYVAHMEADEIRDPARTCYQVNSILPEDIAVQTILPAADDFHARFDAVSRCYRYYIHFAKDPFRQGRSMYVRQPGLLDREAIQAAALLLPAYDRFEPFCKTGSDARHFLCNVTESGWQFDDAGGVYTIRANRFLRGMVRLVVGTCLNAGMGKISQDQLRLVLERQQPLPLAWSVPAEGLYLEEVTYPQ